MTITGLFTQAAAFNLMVREQPRAMAVAVIKKIQIFMRDGCVE